MAMMPYPTQVSLVERHHQPLFADCGTGASALLRSPCAIFHTSARAALAITVLKIVQGICLANSVLSPNGHLCLLHILAAVQTIVNALNMFDSVFCYILVAFKGEGLFGVTFLLCCLLAHVFYLTWLLVLGQCFFLVSCVTGGCPFY